MIDISNRTKRLIVVIVFLISAVSVMWVLSERNFFVFDDTSILLRDSTSSYSDLFSFFPLSVYLDRPIRDIILKWMLQVFGKSYTLHHFFLFIVHLFNVLLVMKVTERCFLSNKANSKSTAFFASVFSSVFFGAWPRSHMAVQWDSANNDLMGTTFALLCLFFHLKENKRNRVGFVILQAFFYYLAIRTKEMFYPLPLILCLYDLWEARDRKTTDMKTRISLSSYVHIVVMVVFFSGIIYGKITDKSITVSRNLPYYQDFNPFRMTKNLIKYCAMLFDVEVGGFTYSRLSISGLIGVCLIVFGFVLSLYYALKRKTGLLFLYMAFGLSICPVLPLTNQLHVLYLYFPSVFIGFIIAWILVQFSNKQHYLLILLCIVLIMVGNAPAVVIDREFWLSTCDMEHETYLSIEEIEKPIEGSTIYVDVPDKKKYTPFYYGPGSIIQFAYDDPSLKTVITQDDSVLDYEAPYLLLKWRDNRVTELERDM